MSFKLWRNGGERVEAVKAEGRRRGVFIPPH
jgi:hypothetical protein